MKKIIRIFDLIELYFPAIAFTTVFITYLIMIFYRYIFHAQLAFVYEFNAISFVWCITLAASYATRKDIHVKFEILYDKLNEKMKLFIRLTGNLLVLLLFVIMLPYVYKSVIFHGIKSSSIIGISFTIIYFPFVILTVLTIIHHIVYIVKDVKWGYKMLRGKDKV